jgi:hypothetical protein
MKARTKKLILVGVLPLCFLFGLGAAWLWYANHYVHQHCIVQTGTAFRIYAADHNGHFPFSTNGFGNALLRLVKAGLVEVNTLCGPDDDGHLFAVALTNNAVVPEDQCSRVYIQGLSETNNPGICLLFDRNSCRGGDHFRSPWGHRLREVCLLDGSWKQVRDEDWPEFSRSQVELLIAAGFARTNALHFYPAAR